MKIALVVCPCWSNSCPPLGIAYLSAVLKTKGYRVKCFDLNIELFDRLKESERNYWGFKEHCNWENPYFIDKVFPLIKNHFDEKIEEILEYNPDIIGATVFYTSALSSLYLAEEIKKSDPGKKIIFGGPECYKEITTSRFLNNGSVDAIVVGEGEQILSELLEAYSTTGRLNNIEGVLVRSNSGIANNTFKFREEIGDLNSLPRPDFSDFNLKKYTRVALPVMTSRGCVARCVFCGEVRYWKKFRYRKAEHILEELKYNVTHYGVHEFFFNDSLINGNPNELSRLVDLIIENRLDISWGGYARIDKRMGLDMLTRMKKAGCHLLSYGIESGSQKVVNDMHKMFFLKDAEENLANTVKAGIEAHVNWIVGFPTETWVDFMRSLLFIYKNRKYITHFNPGYVPCGISPDSDLEKNAGTFRIASKTFLNSWRTLYFRNTIIHRKFRLKILRKFISLLKISHS